MLPTLQKYIFREMGKTFILSSIGLTTVLSTCGGAYWLTRLERVTFGDLVVIGGLVTAVCLAFTLPIAALFSASLTYGRMSADNELVACRSSGINLISLLLPCLAISLISATITFFVFNFVLPGILGRLDLFTHAVVEEYISKLEQGRSVDLRKDRYLFADEVSRVPEAQNAGQRNEAIVLTGVKFIDLENDQIVRFGLGESAAVKFHLERGSQGAVAELNNVQVFDLERRAISDFPHRRLEFDDSKIPGVRQRAKYLPLTDLYRLRNCPEEWFEQVKEKRQIAYRTIVFAELYGWLRGELERHSSVLLDGSGKPVRLHADQLDIERTYGKEEGGYVVRLRGVQVDEVEGAARKTYTSSEGLMYLQYGQDSPPTLHIELSKDVRIHPGDQIDWTRATLETWTVSDVAIPDKVLLPIEEMASRVIQAPDVDSSVLPASARLAVQEFRSERQEYINRIFSEMNVRLVFSLCVIFLAALGAVLGIIYRGGHIMVAFGLSCLPAFAFILIAIGGKSVAKNVLPTGLAIMWGGIALIACLDWVLLKKYLPR